MTCLNQNLWKEYFKGWLITGCVLRTKEIIYMMARKEMPYEEMASGWDSDIPTRIIVLVTNKINEVYGYEEIDNLSNPSLGVARRPKEHGLLLSADPSTFVAVTGSGDSTDEYVDQGSFAVKTLKCVLDYTYAIGPKGNVYKRVDLNNWVKIDQGMDKEKAAFMHDIDAFTDQDLYTVGSDGDVWYFDGNSWSQCGFPSNERLSTVVCAPDGHVYIGGEGGSIWKGRLHTWEKVYSGSFTILWNEMRWFQNQLWVISDYMFRILGDGELIIPQDEQGNDIVLEGHMDVYDGIMAIAGLYHVHTFDGKTLRTIVAPYE